VSPVESQYEDAKELFFKNVNMGMVSDELSKATSSMNMALSSTDRFLDVYEQTEYLLDGIKSASKYVHLGGILIHEARNDNAQLPSIKASLGAISQHMETISFLMNDGFSTIRSRFDGTEVDMYMSKLQAMKNSYNDYLGSLFVEPTSISGVYLQTQNEYEQIFRSQCNGVGYMPEDIFKHIYGYACSSCSYAASNRDNALANAVGKSDGTREGFAEVIPKWIISSLTMSAFLYTACLPPQRTECLDRVNDELRHQKLLSMVSAFEEVKDAVQVELAKIDISPNLFSRKLQALVSSPAPADRKRKMPSECRYLQGKLLKKDVPGYEFAELVTSVHTAGDAEQKFEEVSNVLL
jgi:hypothetical protein